MSLEQQQSEMLGSGELAAAVVVFLSGSQLGRRCFAHFALSLLMLQPLGWDGVGDLIGLEK
jgi:hypothetical protein